MKRQGRCIAIVQTVSLLATITFLSAGSTLFGAEPPPIQATPVSPGISNVLKLVDANVSKEVVIAYITNSPAFAVTPEDVIILKNRGVPDDITNFLLTHSSQAKPKAVAKPAPVLKEVQQANPTVHVINPESYEFWYYNYAYPRARYYSQRWYPPYPYLPYGYGYPGIGGYSHWP